MKPLLTILAGSALTLAGSTAFARSGPTGEEQLAHMLEGRTAGTPQQCISAFPSNQLKVIDRVGVVYDAGKTLWVARAKDPDSLRESNVLIIDRTSSSTLCREDVKRTVDRNGGFLTSIVFLGDFVPYRRG